MNLMEFGDESSIVRYFPLLYMHSTLFVLVSNTIVL